MSSAPQTRRVVRTGRRVALPSPVPAVRCAIYTRKSTSEGLDSDFNTLDAQREACEAYILSQRAEGWVCLDDRFDDSGFSGGTIERPAMQQLLHAIESGSIDCVVVYKVDRLSRSLLDFARLMDIFEKHGVSFVSVTQQFNTASSMGRLVLNVLLSFAQFEREIISERTSDKMCAARRKGKWLGGPPILGYDVDRERHRLVINQEEAAMVRELFELYLQHRSLLKVAQEVNRRGWSTKSYVTTKGVHKGGGRFDKAKLQRILTNVTYTGKIAHKGELYPAEHKAIIEESTFQAVQEVLAENSQHGGAKARNNHNALLKGLLYCGSCGAAMAHTYTKKKNRLYRYYVCSTAQKQGSAACATPSLPAQDIEDAVVEQIRQIANEPEMVEQVFKEAEGQRKANVPKLKAEQRRLQRERQHKQERIKELVAAIGQSVKPLASVSETVEELEAISEQIEQRLMEIQKELDAITRNPVDLADLTSALAMFGPVWEELWPGEKTRVLGLIIERLTYLSVTQKIEIAFKL